MSSPLHLGGSITKTGRLSRLPYEGHQFKTIVMIEKLVKFDIYKVSNPGVISDQEIAKVLGCSERRLNNLRRKAAYLRRRMEAVTGVTINADFTVEQTIQLQKKLLKEMMPAALRIVADQLQMKPQTLAEKKHQASLALDVLDREGSFPKISRSDVHTKVEHDYTKADEVSKELLSAIDGPPQSNENESILEQLLMAKKFSETESLDAAKQEKVFKELDNIPLGSEQVQ